MRGRSLHFLQAGMRAGWIGGIPFSPSFSATKLGRGISTEGDGDSKHQDHLNNSGRRALIFSAPSLIVKNRVPLPSSLASSAKSGISGRKRKSFPFSLSVPTDPPCHRPRRPPRRPGQTPSLFLRSLATSRRRMKSPEGGKVAKRGFELVRWKREVAGAEDSSDGDLVTYRAITQRNGKTRSSLFMSVCIFRGSGSPLSACLLS